MLSHPLGDKHRWQPFRFLQLSYYPSVRPALGMFSVGIPTTRSTALQAVISKAPVRDGGSPSAASLDSRADRHGFDGSPFPSGGPDGGTAGAGPDGFAAVAAPRAVPASVAPDATCGGVAPRYGTTTGNGILGSAKSSHGPQLQ